jgi:hypothetical protein
MYTVPLKAKFAKNVLAAFKKVFKSMKKLPRYAHSDSGTEFISKDVQKYLRQNNIIWFTTWSGTKSNLAERAIQSLMSRMHRLWTNQGNHKWLKALPLLTNSYNKTIHSSINIAPDEVNEQNQYEVWRYLYRDLLSREAEKRKRKRPAFKLADRVRISIAKHQFEKGHAPRWKEEIFLISRVLNTDPVTYYIRDEAGEEIKGLWVYFFMCHFKSLNSIVLGLRCFLRTRINPSYIEIMESNNQDPIFLTLSSGQFMTSKSNPADFSTPLYKSIMFESGEVGLCHISYRSKRRPFTDSASDYWIYFVRGKEEIEKVYEMKKASDTMDNMFSELNAELEKNGSPFVLQYRSLDSSILVQLEIKLAKGKFLRLSADTRKLLGYNQTDFYPKPEPYPGEFSCDSEFFDSLYKGFIFSFEIMVSPVSDKKVALSMSSIYDVAEMVTTFNEACSGLPITFESKGNLIRIQFRDNISRLSFSPKLSFCLGIKEMEIISSNVDLPNVDLGRGNAFGMVECDLAQHQIFGENCLQLLRFFPQAITQLPGDITKLDFSPIQYIPMGKTEFSSIRVKVTNELGETLNVDQELGVTIVLHLRHQHVW